MLVGSEKLCADVSTAKDEFDCIAVLRFGPLACDGFAMNSSVATKGKTLTNLILIQIYKREQSGKATECEPASNGQVLASLESDSWIRNVRSQTRAMLRTVAPFCSVGRFCAGFDILCVRTHACMHTVGGFGDVTVDMLHVRSQSGSISAYGAQQPHSVIGSEWLLRGLWSNVPQSILSVDVGNSAPLWKR
jgi:hypothetical protein